jgi:uncharacterized protein
MALLSQPVLKAELNSPISDSAGILKSEQVTRLHATLSEHNKAGPGRINILIVQKLPPNTTVEKYALEKIDETPPRPGEKLDRILLLVAIEDRSLRIETSEDVRTALSDEVCKGIIDQKIVPLFKEKKYFEGLQAGVNAILTALHKK